MARICPMFSGSSGNSTYIGTPDGGFLIDAGVSFKRLCAALEAAGGCYSEIKGVAVTHEHRDHIQGLKLLLKKSGAALIASAKTVETLRAGDFLPEGVKVIILEKTAEIAGVQITRFDTSHDCEGSSGFSFTLPNEKRITVCTDLGVVTQGVRQAILGSDLVLLESNHDIDMLKKGPYPPGLKMRVLSDNGHISNNACAAELPGLLAGGTTRFILGHLSKQNNIPMLAESTAVAALMDAGGIRDKDYILSVAAPDSNGVTVL